MRKKVAIMIAVIFAFAFSLAGCGKEKEPRLNIVFYSGQRVENGKTVYDFYSDHSIINDINTPYTVKYDGKPHAPLVRIEEVGKPGIEVVPADARDARGFRIVVINYYNNADTHTIPYMEPPVNIGEYRMNVGVDQYGQYAPTNNSIAIIITE